MQWSWSGFPRWFYEVCTCIAKYSGTKYPMDAFLCSLIRLDHCSTVVCWAMRNMGPFLDQQVVGKILFWEEEDLLCVEKCGKTAKASVGFMGWLSGWYKPELPDWLLGYLLETSFKVKACRRWCGFHEFCSCENKAKLIHRGLHNKVENSRYCFG